MTRSGTGLARQNNLALDAIEHLFRVCAVVVDQLEDGPTAVGAAIHGCTVQVARRIADQALRGTHPIVGCCPNVVQGGCGLRLGQARQEHLRARGQAGQAKSVLMSPSSR